jgi:hypothetical protein
MWIHNISGVEKTYEGIPIPDSSYYLIPSKHVLYEYQTNTTFISDLLSGVVRWSNDGITDITNPTAALSAMLGATPPQVEAQTQPFGSKVLPNGKKLFRRAQGISSALSVGSNNISFTIPYTACKITGVQVLNGEIGDTANFKVLDTAAGTVSGVPNYTLNQFGYNVNIVPDVADYPAKYDADMFVGLVLRLEYTSISAKTIYINFDLHEVI